jgi:hypothetical protein
MHTAKKEKETIKKKKSAIMIRIFFAFVCNHALRKIITWGEGSLRSSVGTVEILTAHGYRLACRNDVEKKGEGEKDAESKKTNLLLSFFPHRSSFSPLASPKPVADLGLKSWRGDGLGEEGRKYFKVH